MWRPARWIGATVLLATVTAPTRFHAARILSHQVIVVYIGVNGVDHAMAGFADTVRAAATKQLAQTDRHLVLRGVSLNPEIAEGMQDLLTVGAFDEVSLGGNWTNSAVVRYLGSDFGKIYPKAGVPQVIVLERDVDNQIVTLHVGPEREVARYLGTKDIWDWAHSGAPLPK